MIASHPLRRAVLEPLRGHHRALAERGLTQMQAAEIPDIDRPKVPRLLSGRYAGFTLDRLLRLLLALDKDISIVIAPKQAERGHISVQAS